jgi:phage gp36-like protein
MIYVTYDDLVSRYGQDNALQILKTIERLAEINNELEFMDRESRLQNALDALNDTSLTTKH